ncbi:MAG: sugar ABC transporter ATP-binding protein [Rhizobiales bacterium]|nr:sugar ABC transporter ATP-binding protein [Hyphomicrobiales bacterium]
MKRAFMTLDGLGKTFGANIVLADVSLDLRPGEIVALLGANGAGKSTLVKILSGAYRPDQGTMAIDGKPQRFASPLDARRAGIFTVHQIINDGVVQDLTVAENLLLDELCAPESPIFLDRRSMRVRAAKVARSLALDLPLDKPVRDIGQADRQMVAIARALAHQPRLLILDEPTSSLSEAEAERLFATIEHLRRSGVAILYISHRMADIRRLADRAVVLRDGRLTGIFEAPLDLAKAVSAMLGREFSAMAARQAATAGREVVRFDKVQLAGHARPFDLSLNENEIVVLTGLIGAGKSEIAQCLFGLRKPVAGRITLDGADWAPRSPAEALGRGVFMASEDRANNSLLPETSITRNMTLPFLRLFSRLGLVDRGRERATALSQIERLFIKAPSPEAPIEALSGGNQQKVVLARWLIETCRVLILDEPFQGVDIAARRDIGQHLRETARGRATLLISADIEEAFEVADRIIVVRDFRAVASHPVHTIGHDALIAEIAAIEHEEAA